MYVFGIDMPLMEILFVVFIINLVILLFMLYEMIAMRRLMVKEEKDIKKMDLITHILENFINENPTKNLIDYVYKYLEAGVDRNEVKKALMDVGLYETTINRLFSQYDRSKNKSAK
jgi:hypothetical protein